MHLLASCSLLGRPGTGSWTPESFCCCFRLAMAPSTSLSSHPAIPECCKAQTRSEAAGDLALLQLSLTGTRIAKHILHTAHTPRPTERTVCSLILAPPALQWPGSGSMRGCCSYCSDHIAATAGLEDCHGEQESCSCRTRYSTPGSDKRSASSCCSSWPPSRCALRSRVCQPM